MKRLLGFVVVAAFFLSAGVVRAQDAVTIKFKDVAQGDVSQVDKSETATVATKVADAAGKSLVDTKQVISEAASFTETVVKCEAKKTPTLLERKYDKATLTVDGKAKDLPYQGKTVVIEKKGDKYSFTVGGKELMGEDAQVLFKEFSKGGDDKTELEKAMLPKTPVKVNDTWKIDMTPFVKDAVKGGEVELDADKTKGSGTLLKAYKKDDKQFGVMKMEMTMPLLSLGKGPMKMTAQEGSLAQLELTMDVCIDGSAQAGTAKSGMKMDVKALAPTADGTKVTVNVSVQTHTEETRKDLTKK